MIRFKLDSESTQLLDRITSIYNFKKDTITGRIALSLSIEKGVFFHEHEESLPQNGREYTPTSNIFGRLINDVDNTIIYKAFLDQHYSKDLSENEFIKLYKLHLKSGLNIWQSHLNNLDITKGEHISFLLKSIKKGLELSSTKTLTSSNTLPKRITKEFKSPLSFEIGKTEAGEIIEIRINDLREFDNRNIAIAGMAGSGKTQLIKDILYQVSKNSGFQLKYIFFDYKGEGNPEQLQPFLNATQAEFVDIINDGGLDFNPFTAINQDSKHRPFSIRAFVDTIATFVPSVGVSQTNILYNIITDLFDNSNGEYPSIEDLFSALNNFYTNAGKAPDTLYAGIQALATNIFNCNVLNTSILDKSVYLNLPPALSDTLRQLVVFLLLRYFSNYFSSTNDCIPDGHIFPLRYVIVIDEAHIYLKNRNARKALEEVLRVLRSKGVIIIMLSQGVEDYKTKDFDFASQVKLPICLNIQNKDYKLITNFLGTPTSKFKLEEKILKLDSGKALINIGEPKILEIRQWWKTNANGL